MIFKAKHLSRYKEIGRLVWRHGRSNVFRQLAALPGLEDEEAVAEEKGPTPEELVNDLEQMGPTFVKLGQILSSRADLLPEPYLKALARLQDHVQPFPYAQVEAIIQDELGVRLSKAFISFDAQPLAAASLGQVHHGVTHNGTEVAVKVQRPDIRKQIAEDLEVLEEISAFADEHTDVGRRHRFGQVVKEFRKTLVQELDYQREASNLSIVGASLKNFPHIRVAQPVADYTTRAVLTMTFLTGRKITDLSPLARMELNGAMLAEELFRAYLQQILVDGLFHADPHPGNVFITDDGCIGLLDLGMIGRLAPGMQENLIKLLLAISEGRAEDAGSIAVRISETTEDFDEPEFKRRMSGLVLELQDHTLRRMNIGSALMEVSRSAGETGLYVPTELTLLGKTLLQLDEIGRFLEPSFDPNAAIRNEVSNILRQRLRKDLTPGNLFSSLLEMKDFAAQLPSRVNKVFDTMGKGQIELKLRTDDTLRVLEGFQKVANRIAAGVVLGSLIVGAALLTRVPTTFILFGYPGLAIILFLLAAAGGLWLLFDIFFRDAKEAADSAQTIGVQPGQILSPMVEISRAV